MASDMMLYWGSGSTPCWRVQLALEEKGLSGYKNKLLSFEKKEHKSEEVMKINPRGQLPTFKHGNLVLNESMAACDYLESAFKSQGTRLLPENPAELALVLQRKYEMLNLQKKGNEEVVYYMLFNKKEDQDASRIAEKKKNLVEELHIWEGYLKETGAYVAGKNFSMADVMFFPQLAFFVRVGLKLGDKFPSLESYYNRVCERQSAKDSWPPHWKDGSGPVVLADV